VEHRIVIYGDTMLLEIADAESRMLDTLRVPASGLEIKRH
jgi:hypothetical protein